VEPPASALLLLRTERRRWTLRARVVLTILAVALAPQLLVFAWSQLDRNVPGQMWGRVRDVAVRVVPLVKRPDVPAGELEAIARESHTYVRVLGEGDAALFDESFDDPSGPLDPVERFFLGPATRRRCARSTASSGRSRCGPRWSSRAARGGTSAASTRRSCSARPSRASPPTARAPHV
jgi:hypothetical protein